jgi:hypothetical protein
MLHVDDLIETRPEQILFTRLTPFPWPHRAPPAKAFPSERITNQVCKESPSTYPLSGKLDCPSVPFPDSKSMTWEFFTDDQLLFAFGPISTRRRIGAGWPGAHYEAPISPEA